MAYFSNELTYVHKVEIKESLQLRHFILPKLVRVWHVGTAT